MMASFPALFVCESPSTRLHSLDHNFYRNLSDMVGAVTVGRFSIRARAMEDIAYMHVTLVLATW